MRTPYITISVLMLALAIGGGAYFLSAGGDLAHGTPQTQTAAAGGEIAGKPPDPVGNKLDVAAIDEPAELPAGYIKYTNAKYGFSFYHAPESTVKEYDEGGGAMTVVLENLERVRGMQVFIVPYEGSTISEERFHADVPSGVRENVENATLDGVKAVTFNSKDMLLGQTREIWSIHGGYLYEVTTFSGVARWFTPIIQSWKWLK